MESMNLLLEKIEAAHLQDVHAIYTVRTMIGHFEAVGALVQFLFEKVNVNRVQAEVMPANERSGKVLLKNGFIKEGLLRQATLWSGKGLVDLEIYGVLKEDYKVPYFQVRDIVL